MLPGFNHDVRHAGRVFHVQTEDAGADHAFLTTHVFLEGRVIAEDRVSYADIASTVGGDDATRAELRKRMQDLHKRSMKRLVRGELDAGFAPRPPASRRDEWEADDDELQAILAIFAEAERRAGP